MAFADSEKTDIRRFCGYPAYGAARSKVGMRPETLGPIPDALTRDTLRAQWWSAIDEGNGEGRGGPLAERNGDP